MSDATDDLLSAILAFINDVNRGNAAAALGCFTDDVIIVEDLPPYRISGADAGQKCLSLMGGNAQRLGATTVVMHPAKPRRIEADDQTGYAIIPGELTLDGPSTNYARTARSLSRRGARTGSGSFVR